MHLRRVLALATACLASFLLMWLIKVKFRLHVRAFDRALDGWTPHGGSSWDFPSHWGDTGASMAVGFAAVALLLALHAWRSAIVAGTFAFLGGWLVMPLKYGGSWAPYLSGHTVGGMLPWGLFLLLGVAAMRRRGSALPTDAERVALGLWLAVGGAVGLHRLYVHAHVASDVLLAWTYSAGLVLLALWLDGVWHRRVKNVATAQDPTPPPPALAADPSSTTPIAQPSILGKEP